MVRDTNGEKDGAKILDICTLAMSFEEFIQVSRILNEAAQALPKGGYRVWMRLNGPVNGLLTVDFFRFDSTVNIGLISIKIGQGAKECERSALIEGEPKWVP